jgi:hypothetical protein
MVSVFVCPKHSSQFINKLERLSQTDTFVKLERKMSGTPSFAIINIK